MNLLEYIPESDLFRPPGGRKMLSYDEAIAYLITTHKMAAADAVSHVDRTKEEANTRALADTGRYEQFHPYSSEFDFVTQFFAEHPETVDAAGHVQDDKAGLEMLFLKVGEYNNELSSIPKKVREEMGASRLGLSDVRTYFSAVTRRMGLEARATLRDRLAYQPEAQATSEAEFDRLADCCAERTHPLWAVHRCIFMHQFWQVKRKLWGLPTEFEMLLALYTDLSVGKSTLLRRLAEPLRELYAEPKIGDLVRQFSGRFTETYFFVNIEEMEKSEDRQIEEIKAFITQIDRKERGMMTTTAMKYKQNMTLFSTTNKPIRRIFQDYTNMRRFWEIDLRPIVQKTKALNWDTINSLDVLAMWRGINEEDDMSPKRKNHSRLGQLLSDNQDQLRSRTITEQFLEQCAFYPVVVPKTYSVRDLYMTEFKMWRSNYYDRIKFPLTKLLGQLEDTRMVSTYMERGQMFVVMNDPAVCENPYAAQEDDTLLLLDDDSTETKIIGEF